MSAVGVSIMVNIASSFIYDAANSIFKYLSGSSISEYKLKRDIEKYIDEHIEEEFISLTTSDIIAIYLNSPQIYDVINSFFLAKNINKNYEFRNESNTSLDDIIEHFSNEIIALYEADESVIVPQKEVVLRYLKFIIDCIESVVFINLNADDKSIIYFINKFIEQATEDVSGIIKKLESDINQLLKSILSYDSDFEKIKDEYYDILKKKNSEAHIYLLDKFPFDDFYIPPRLEKASQREACLKMFELQNDGGKVVRENEDISWEYIFKNQNIIYLTGGAGYGKSLFLKKIINDYDKLGIYKGDEYIVIYGELKNFYLGNSNTPIPVTDFLLNSARTATLLDETKISKDFLNYYLNTGRCIILLDALDEVDKTKRNELHESIIAYFKSQNPNNKICITSRDRGFIPENDIEEFVIRPLDRKQIESYVDKIIELKKFDEAEKDSFMEQTQILVKKGFLNSFLVLSLLINIYKAEKELPENKLELYQKCFEYISNKREKDKSMGVFDWKMISPLMKDNTFIELAINCYPNNISADVKQIKNTLLDIYSSKYGNEADTENAIDEFLRFCSDRTELFVPSAEENKFKFFHRSFFEYFYSQYIFLNFEQSSSILEEFKKFDVDSEIFELTVAMLKQKSEKRYQEVIKLMIKEVGEEFNENKEFLMFNILVLTMQTVDDVLYKRSFVDLLIRYKDIILENVNKFHNLHLIVNIFKNDDSFSEEICSEYSSQTSKKLLNAFFEVCCTLDEITCGRMSRFLDDIFAMRENESIKINLDKLPFYINLFISVGKLEPWLENINNYQINVLMNQNSKKTRKYTKYLEEYRSFNEKQKKNFLVMLVNLASWD